MSFIDLVRKRHSIRSFKNQPVSDELLHQILETAILAPSAGNLQSYEIYTVSDNAIKQQLAHAALDQNFLQEAPINIIFCANMKRASVNYGHRGNELYSVQDATIAAAYLQLAAADLELATVWIGAFEESQVKKILHLPDHLKPIAIIPVGYPNESPSSAPRRSFKEIVH